MREVDERALFVRGPVVVFKWKNADGWPVEYVSVNAEEVFGYTGEAFRSGEVAYAAVVHEEDLSRVGEEVATAAASTVESFVHEPYRIVHRNGSIRWLHDVTRILRGDDGVATHFLGYVIDITDRVRAEEDKRALERQLLHAQKLESLGVLAGGVAHDFNNLLTGILGEASLARRRLSSSPEDVDRRLERIEQLALRAAELTRQLLAYSGKGRFIVEPTDLAVVVREMASMLETVISKKADLRLELAAVPAIRSDRAQLQQVVMNLITNASDALEDESGKIVVATRVEELKEGSTDTTPPLPPGRYVLLEVADDGNGMTNETRDQLFDPFFTTKAHGRGLGMAAISGILRGHGGAIRVRSSPGNGSRFMVLFPASDDPVRYRKSTPADGAWRGQGTVLIVDDEPAIRALASCIFEDLGFDTLTADDGGQAVERFRENQGSIVLVLLDMMMPVKDGAETLLEIRALDADVPVVMCSGYDKTDAISRIAGSEVSGFVQKPYRPEDIERAARKALGV